MKTIKPTKNISLILVILMLLGIMPISSLSASATTSEPESKDGYYLISSTDELYWFADQVNSGNTDINAKLVSDISVNENSVYINKWTPIGNETYKYSGTFDGDNHTVNGICIDSSTQVNAGFFGVIENAEIKNINLTKTYIKGNNEVGGICGTNYNSSITRCSNEGSITSTNSFAGGICGINKGDITECYNSGNVVAGFLYAGGICGKNEGGNIKNCYSSCSTVLSSYHYSGINGGSTGGTISNCYYDSSACNDYSPYNSNTAITNVSGKNTSAFKNGEVAYLLNNGVTDGTQVFYQNIDNEKTNDTYPTFTNNGDNTIYKSEQNGFVFYSNIENAQLYLNKNENGYFVINNYKDLCTMANRINSSDINYSSANYILEDDIDCTNTNMWVPVTTFNTTFDGNGHTISNLNAEGGIADGSRHGLFATIGKSGVVKNLTVSNASVFSAESPVQGSGVIAMVNNGKIESCKVKNSSVQLGNWTGLGGISGVNNGTINNCCVIDTNLTRRWGGSSLTSNKSIGGITEINNGKVTNCYTYNCKFANGNATSKGGIISSGNAPENCYYFTNSSVSTSFGTSMTKEQFASGEVTYLLNKGVTDCTQVWYQNVNNIKTKDSYPMFDGGIIFKNNNTYTNTPYDPYLVTEENYEKLCFSEEFIGYYTIFDVDDLFWFADQVNSGKTEMKVFLISDITNTDTEKEWTPIANNNHGSAYTGTFDGQNHTISGLYCTCNDACMFYYFKGILKNLNVTDSYFSGTNIGCSLVFQNGGTIENCSFRGTVYGKVDAAGICVSNNGGTITNCINYGEITGCCITGGICASNHGKVTNCTNYGKVISENSAGGIVGENTEGGKITSCKNTANISVPETLTTYKGSSIGGICGNNTYNSTIKDCTNSGNVSGIYRCGGITGYSQEASIDNCSNTGSVSGDHTLGGICGDSYLNNTISNCNNSGNITGNESLGGISGNVSKTTFDNCINSGAVIGKQDRLGGICGNVTSSTVSNCENKGSINGSDYTGGICGYLCAVTVTDCTNLGTVISGGTVGGIGGHIYHSVSFTGCTNSGNISNTSYGGYTGGICGRCENKTLIDSCVNTGVISGYNICTINELAGSTSYVTSQNCTENGSIVIL